MTKLTQKEKIKKAEELFDKIKSLFPDKNISMTIHSIDLENLPENWKVKDNTSNDRSFHFKSANRVSNFWDITLYG